MDDSSDRLSLEQGETERLYGDARALIPQEQASFVEALCAGRPELRDVGAEVLSLLEHAEAAESFFARLREEIVSSPPWAEIGGVDPMPGPAGARELPGGTRAGRYLIVERIGAGGMGTVYRAHDPALDRDVALKLLPPHLSGDPASRERFLIEARAAAALDHPNICTIHEVGEIEDGRLFLAMACYEGKTLKERLARGPLPVGEAAAYTVQLARALAAAHARGIVHRDVKPGNALVLPDGTVKLLDFGLARVADATLTVPGLTPGTVAYMSPEQARGDRLDHRTDLFSLGVVLYEMLAGVRPFRGGDRRAVLAAVEHEHPEALPCLRPEVPRSLAQVVARLLEKDPVARYDHADELLRDLDPNMGSHRRVRRTAFLRRAVPALVGLGGFLAIAGVMLQPGSSATSLDPERVVVAPFENRTGDPALDPVGSLAADWVTEGISRAAGANVVPTSVALVSARRVQESLAAGARVDPLEALAEETGAGLVVSGAYYAAGDGLQFLAQITDARQRRLLRALEPAGGEGEAPAAAIDVLRQRTLAALAPFLHPRFGPFAERYGDPPSYEAHQAYVEGMEAQIRGRWRESNRHLERALSLDTTYLAPAWLMSWNYLNLGDRTTADSIVSWLDRSRERLTPFQQASLDMLAANLRHDRIAAYEAASRVAAIAPQSLPHVQLAAEAARLNRPREAIRVLAEIDPTRGVVRGWPAYWFTATEAHHVRGHHRQELREARRARALFPDEPQYLFLEARALAALGRVFDVEAVVSARTLLPEDRDPSLGALLRLIGDELRIHGRPGAARMWYDRAIEWYRGRSYEEQARHRTTVGMILVASGRWSEAQPVFRDLATEEPDNLEVQGFLGIIAARLGDSAEAERISGLLAERNRYGLGGSPAFQRACIAAQLGRMAEAVALLREAFSQGYAHGWGPRHAPCLDPLRDYGPFRDLMRPAD
jgi:tetratricopeptide (TPR) repeat protein